MCGLTIRTRDAHFGPIGVRLEATDEFDGDVGPFDVTPNFAIGAEATDNIGIDDFDCWRLSALLRFRF